MVGSDLTAFFVDSGTHPRLPLSPPRDDLAAGESSVDAGHGCNGAGAAGGGAGDSEAEGEARRRGPCRHGVQDGRPVAAN